MFISAREVAGIKIEVLSNRSTLTGSAERYMHRRFRLKALHGCENVCRISIFREHNIFVIGARFVKFAKILCPR